MKRSALLMVLTVMLAALVAVSSAHAEDLRSLDGSDTRAGIYLRLRQETWSNTDDLDNDNASSLDRNFFRLKTSLWYREDYSDTYDFFVKVTNEARYMMNTLRDESPFEEDEIVFENLYASARDLFGVLDLKVGRQDLLMTHGEGFLIMDGTPLDGSRTYYFNAAKATIRLGERSNVDLMFIADTETDRYLPSLYASEKRILNSSDEQGIVVYGRTRIGDLLVLEPYFMNKKEERADSLDLNTIGARAVWGMAGLRVRGELARQFGDYDSGIERTGTGGYIFTEGGDTDIAWGPTWEMGYIYLSGDDPATTDKDEGWDPLFSRWPWLSGLFAYTLTNERGYAYWSNIQWYRVGVKLAVSEDTSLELRYNYLLANEDTPASVPGERERGHIPQITISHTFSDRLDGYLKVEQFIPGDHYAGDDQATFVRWQLQWKM